MIALNSIASQKSRFQVSKTGAFLSTQVLSMSIADQSALWELCQWLSTTKVTASHIIVTHTYFTRHLPSIFLSRSNIHIHTYSLWRTVTKINLHFRKQHIHVPHREASHDFKGCHFSGPQVNIQFDRPKKLTRKTWLVKLKPSEWKYIRKRKKCGSVMSSGVFVCRHVYV